MTSTARSELGKIIPRRPRVTATTGLVLALAFAAIVLPLVTADRWLQAIASVEPGKPAPLTVRVPALAGWQTTSTRFGTGGIVIARGDVVTSSDADHVHAVTAATPRGALPYVALFLLPLVLAAIFTHHMRRSTHGRLLRVQLVSLGLIAVLAVAVKVALLLTSVSALVVPVALFSLVATLALDRTVGLATGVLAALIVALLGPFDLGVAIVLLVQGAVAGLVVEENPKDRVRAVAIAGALTTLCTAGVFVLLAFLTTGTLPVLADPLRTPWLAALLGPLLASVLALPLVPVYQLLVGEITRSTLLRLEDLDQPLLKQIAQKAPGSWQHSRAMANMAEAAANAIGASSKLVRVGALYHDLGKSLAPSYFIENLKPGETSPHDSLAPEVSTDAIFAHVTEGIVAARKAGLHERIVDFMHMHHGNGVLEYFWGKAQEQGNPRGFTVEDFRYPGHPPQSRETAILAITDAVEAASRTLKAYDEKTVAALVQRIVYGKLHLGQLDESGLSMKDLRVLSESLSETVRAANHNRIEYPWQKAEQDASATSKVGSTTAPRLDSLDRTPVPTRKLQLEIVDAGESRELPTSASQDDTQERVRASAPVRESARIAAVRGSDRMPAVEPAATRGSDRMPAVPEPAATRESARMPAVPEPAPSRESARMRALRDSARVTAPGELAASDSGRELAASDSARVPVPSGLRPPRAASVPPTNRPPSERARSVSDGDRPSERARSVSDGDSDRPRPPSAPPARAWTGESRTITPSDLRGYRDSRDTAPTDIPTLAPAVGRAPTGDRPAVTRTPTGERAVVTTVPRTRTGERPIVTPPQQRTTLPGERPIPPGERTILPGERIAARAATAPSRISGDAREWTANERKNAPQPAQHPAEWTPTPKPLTRIDESAASWTETGATDAPWPELAGETEDQITEDEAPPPGMTTLRGGLHVRPPQVPGGRPIVEERARFASTLAPDAPSRLPARAEILDEDAPATAFTDKTATGFPKLTEEDLARMAGDLPPMNEDLRNTLPPDLAARTLPSLPAMIDDTGSVDIQVIEGDEAVSTQPAMPRFVDARTERSNANVVDRRDLPPRAPSMADRIDAAMASDEWGSETPVKAPSPAELRSLLGAPDPTKQQSIAEIERLHSQSLGSDTPDPELLRSPRRAGPTNEVDPDDIEAAIEIVPPQRRPSSIGMAKPKKPE